MRRYKPRNQMCNKTIELLLTKQPHLTTLSTLEYHQNAHSDVMAGVKGYSVGDIQAQAAFTSEIEINGHPSLQDFVNFQDVHRKVMDARPGMYLKYLPHQFDVVNGQLRTGGAYLFDTHENAADYWDWTTNIFEVDEPKVKFWSQPLFKASKRFIWQVIGATNFGPVEYHAVGRFQRWTYDGANVEKELQRIYPELKRKAEEQGALAFWLLHHPEEKQIGIQLAFGKMEGTDPLTVGYNSLAHAGSQASLDSIFPSSLKAQKSLDRTSLFIAVWMPTSRLAGGAHHWAPMYPTLPTVQDQ
ncbi:uncharacterized protein CTRU02_210615 [Colletotrichum truncatum]|uniref:Uncharacterized protein n=1 Tax=Colletotrichum truncatum TaxID=5467 RepID=A0ACC3YQS4_COLTU